MKNIKVLVVHDSAGKNVFDGVNATGNPSKIGFAALTERALETFNTASDKSNPSQITFIFIS